MVTVHSAWEPLIHHFRYLWYYIYFTNLQVSLILNSSVSRSIIFMKKWSLLSQALKWISLYFGALVRQTPVLTLFYLCVLKCFVWAERCRGLFIWFLGIATSDFCNLKNSLLSTLIFEKNYESRSLLFPYQRLLASLLFLMSHSKCVWLCGPCGFMLLVT